MSWRSSPQQGVDLTSLAEGTRVRNAFNGETFIFTHLAENQDFAQFDVLLEAGSMLTGTGMHHVHPNADETFDVIRGKLWVVIDGTGQALGPGESLTVRRGTPHHFRNGHNDETLFTARFSPAQQFLRFFLNMSRCAADHPEWYDERGEPPLLLRSLALHAYADHGYAGGIPVWLQRLVFAALAPVARLRGYRLSIPPAR